MIANPNLQLSQVDTGPKYCGSILRLRLHRLWLQMASPAQDGSTRIRDILAIFVQCEEEETLLYLGRTLSQLCLMQKMNRTFTPYTLQLFYIQYAIAGTAQHRQIVAVLFVLDCSNNVT